MPVLTSGLGTMKLQLRGCGISMKKQLCSFLHRTLWHVGSWQGREAISLFINLCLLTPALTAGVTPTVALTWWVVPFLPQSEVTDINPTSIHWRIQLFKHQLWSMYEMLMTKKWWTRVSKRRLCYSLLTNCRYYFQEYQHVLLFFNCPNFPSRGRIPWFDPFVTLAHRLLLCCLRCVEAVFLASGVCSWLKCTTVNFEIFHTINSSYTVLNNAFFPQWFPGLPNYIQHTLLTKS